MAVPPVPVSDAVVIIVGPEGVGQCHRAGVNTIPMAVDRSVVADIGRSDRRAAIGVQSGVHDLDDLEGRLRIHIAWLRLKASTVGVSVCVAVDAIAAVLVIGPELKILTPATAVPPVAAPIKAVP